ncbi:hypothetical protein BSKO_05710 [Bryopsis sp. KO-2023]|nr:hypothetical protein BSKO_05710 [Bryopsis sp. KO-2023]
MHEGSVACSVEGGLDVKKGSKTVDENQKSGEELDEERRCSNNSCGDVKELEVWTPPKNDSGGGVGRGGSSRKRRRSCGGNSGAKKRERFVQNSAEPRRCLWEPPVSPYGLIEELLYWDPWKLLIACILLNKTSGVQVRSIIWEFFKNYPTPERLLEEKDGSKIFNLIKALGLGSKRSETVKRFSDEYLHEEWTNPIVLHGIGRYASDAYFIFCRGQWRDATPEDKELRRYVEWLALSDGVGYAATRDPIPIPQEI